MGKSVVFLLRLMYDGFGTTDPLSGFAKDERRKRNMKKILALVLALALVACASLALAEDVKVIFGRKAREMARQKQA